MTKIVLYEDVGQMCKWCGWCERELLGHSNGITIFIFLDFGNSRLN